MNLMASSVHYTVIVVVAADSILTGCLRNVTGMSPWKRNRLWSRSFGALMRSPSQLRSLVKNPAVDLCSQPFLLVSLKFCFSVSVVRFSLLSPSAPSPPPLLAQYSAETRCLGSRTGKCARERCWASAGRFLRREPELHVMAGFSGEVCVCVCDWLSLAPVWMGSHGNAPVCS